MKYNVLFVFLFFGCMTFAQDQQEQDYRIKKSQFPELRTNFMIADSKMKKIRYYKEIDSSKTTYSIKFKMDRLYYHLNYDAAGNLINSGFRVKEIDIPQESYVKIKSYLANNFEKIKIRRIWQKYPIGHDQLNGDLLKNTFQNLLLPNNEYKLKVLAKKKGERQAYELWFDAEGNFKRMRIALPTNFDHVLY